MKMDSRYYKGFTCNIEATTGYGSFTGECKEIGFSTTRVHLRNVRQLFDEAVDTYLARYLTLKGEKKMKITFTYGYTVKIILTQDEGGFYVYTPKNHIASSIKFFSVKDAILFFSEFLPVKAYDKEENSLSFEVTLEYRDKDITFYMKDEDKTKRAWTNYTTENKGFNDVLRVNTKKEDSIDDILKYFTKWVDTKSMQEEKKEVSQLTLTYYYFTSKVYWDSNECWWYVSHIFNKANKDILKEDAIIGIGIQELQTKFEEYIDRYLKERDKVESNSVKINNKTFDIWVDPNTKDYYCYFASLKLTGKTVEEVKDQINKIYWAFS